MNLAVLQCNEMIPFQDSRDEDVFACYPEQVRPKMCALRDLVFTTAQRIGVHLNLVETLKWGEPSYVCKTGTAIRMGWDTKKPKHYRIFFHCQSLLISTFRELYPHSFDFEANRSIRFTLNQNPNLSKLGHCIELALRYHQLKKLPLLGASTKEDVAG